MNWLNKIKPTKGDVYIKGNALPESYYETATGQALYTITAIRKAYDENDLEISSLRKQVSDYKALTESMDARIATLQAGRAEWREAVNMLSSERQVNAVLNEVIAALHSAIVQPVEVQQAIEARTQPMRTDDAHKK